MSTVEITHYETEQRGHLTAVVRVFVYRGRVCRRTVFTYSVAKTAEDLVDTLNFTTHHDESESESGS